MAPGVSSLLGEGIPHLKAAKDGCPPKFQGFPSLKVGQIPCFSILGLQKACSLIVGWVSLSL